MTAGTHYNIPFLIISLIFLVLVSAFFSSSETSLMAINRYKLKHLAQNHHRGAKRVLALLSRTDRLLSVILIGNTLANILSASIATLLGALLYGDKGIVIATIGLTIIMLIFGELAPKTFAARYAESYALFISLPLRIILILLYPIVWLGNSAVKLLFLPFKINISHGRNEQLNTEELKSLLKEGHSEISSRHQDMLISILELENISAEDLMIPRAEIVGINIQDSWHDIMKQLRTSQHTRLPLYDQNINNIIGILHLRDVLHLIVEEKLDKDTLIKTAHEPYFVLEFNPLNKQLLHFQHSHNRTAFVVDEYGNIKGLLTLEDLLEEIVGKFTSNVSETTESDITPEKSGSYIIEGSTSIRDINRRLNWQFTSQEAKTLSGLITLICDDIPKAKSCVRDGQYGIEVLQVKNNLVKSARVFLIEPTQ